LIFLIATRLALSSHIFSQETMVYGVYEKVVGKERKREYPHL
jgi:hypothetical protein